MKRHFSLLKVTSPKLGPSIQRQVSSNLDLSREK